MASEYGPYNARVLRDGSVRYWSVYAQRWRVAYCRLDVSDRDHAALDERDRSLIAGLPLEED